MYSISCRKTACDACCFFFVFLSSGGWVKLKLKLDACDLGRGTSILILLGLPTHAVKEFHASRTHKTFFSSPPPPRYVRFINPTSNAMDYLWGVIVIRTHDVHKNPYIPVFVHTILGPDYYVPS